MNMLGPEISIYLWAIVRSYFKTRISLNYSKTPFCGVLASWQRLLAKVIVNAWTSPLTKNPPQAFQSPTKEWYCWKPSPSLRGNQASENEIYLSSRLIQPAGETLGTYLRAIR